MAIPNVDTIPPMGIAKFVPAVFKDKKFVKMTEGMHKHVVYLFRDMYPAKDANHEVIKSKIDGSVINRVVYYIGFDDDTYSFSKYDVMVNLLDTWMTPYIDDTKATNAINLKEIGEDCDVVVTMRDQKMGSKTYPVPVLKSA